MSRAFVVVMDAVGVGELPDSADYGDAGIAKWNRLGRKVFDRNGTSIWDLG